MGELGAYLVSVTAAALVCGFAKTMIPEGLLGAALKLVTGIMMVLAVAGPWINFRLPNLDRWSQGFYQEAEDAASAGAASAMEALREGISRQTQTYIQDKAKALGAELTVEVILTEGSIPAPKGVVLRGRISPYGRSVLSEYLQKELGIEMEEQTWIT